jgi:hypothetical protein
VDPGIDAIDAELSKWISETVPGVAVSLGAAPADAKAPVVFLLLQRLADGTGSRERVGRPVPRRIELGYFVAAGGRDPAQAHKTIGELLFAALERVERGSWRVSFETPPPELWSALTLPPLPAFLLHVPLVRERPAPRVKMARELVLKPTPAVAFEGLLLGPADVPLADVIVELGGLAQRTRTDGRGRFRFGAVPPDFRRHPLRVHAKGRAFDLTAGPATPGAPCVIRLEDIKNGEADAGPPDQEN